MGRDWQLQNINSHACNEVVLPHAGLVSKVLSQLDEQRLIWLIKDPLPITCHMDDSECLSYSSDTAHCQPCILYCMGMSEGELSGLFYPLVAECHSSNPGWSEEAQGCFTAFLPSYVPALCILLFHLHQPIVQLVGQSHAWEQLKLPQGHVTGICILVLSLWAAVHGCANPVLGWTYPNKHQRVVVYSRETSVPHNLYMHVTDGHRCRWKCLTLHTTVKASISVT